jgi:hypothetical protein
MIIKYLLLLSFFLQGCSSSRKVNDQNRKEVNFNSFLKIQVGNDSGEILTNDMGDASEKRNIQKEDIGYNNTEKWIYKELEHRRISIILVNNIVQSVSMNIWDEDSESDTHKLLEKIKGDWKIISAPVVNPHAMPFMCYLEDEKKGLFIGINAHRKAVESVIRWNPSFRFKRMPNIKAGAEYCISGHCASVTNSNDWKHNHCEYLKKIIK